MQVTDNSANKFKNSYFNDINNSGFAIETSGNAIVHGTIESDTINSSTGNFTAIDVSSGTVYDSFIIGSDDISANLTVSGRIGINTTTPNCSLDISASDAIQVPVGYDNDINDMSLNVGMFRYDLSNNTFVGYSNDKWLPFYMVEEDASGVANTIANGDAGIIVTTVPGEIIKFFDNDQNYLIMDSNGNFGLGGMEEGTRPLNATLDVYGNVDISGQTNINNTVIDSDGIVSTNGSVTINNDGNLYFTDGTYIGRGLKTNVLDGASNINIGISNEVYIHYDWQDGTYLELMNTLEVKNVSSIDTRGKYAIVGNDNTGVAYIYHFIDNTWKTTYTLVSGISSFGSSVSIYDSSFTFVGVQSNNSISVYGRGLSKANSVVGQWSAIACSDDGKKIVAAQSVQTTSGTSAAFSTDGGFTWTDSVSGSNQKWSSLASSSDGMKLAGASIDSGGVFVSKDGGANWKRVSPFSGNWQSIASSSDGEKLATVIYNGYIYTSENRGTDWYTQTSAGNRNWYSIASSSDGKNLAAVVYGGYIYTSTDSGNTWITQIDSGSRNWYSIASSSDGTKLAAVVRGGYIYTSTNSGHYWIQQNNAGSRNWQSITSSSDGTKLAATVYGGYIYISTDSGYSWMEQTYAGSRNWQSITSSSDGTKLSATVSGEYIYTTLDVGNVLSQDISGSIVSTYGEYTATASDNTLFIYRVGSTSTWTIFTSLALGFTIQSIDIYDNKVITGGNGHMNVYQINGNSSLTPLIQVTSASSSFGSSVGIYGNYAIVGDPNGNAVIYNTNGNIAATLENAATSVSINENYAIIGDGANTVYKYSFDKIRNIWNTTPVNIDVSNNLVSIDDYILISDATTGYIYSTVTSNSIPHNAIAYGKDKYLTVGSTAETVFSSNDGIQWSSVITDFSYNSVTGIKKVIIESANNFFINEIQVWIDGSNVALNADSSTNVIDNNVTNIDASGSANDYFYGQYLSVILDKNYQFENVQSVVIYNNIENAKEIDGATLYLKDEYNNVLYQTIIEGSYNYYRYDVSANGPLIGGTGSGEGIIAPIDFSYNKVKFGINNNDISNNDINVNEIQIWEHVDNSGASVQSLAVTFNTGVMTEVQLWANDGNQMVILQLDNDNQGQVASLNNNDLTDTYSGPPTSLYALKESTLINDIQSIVIYTPPYSSAGFQPPDTFTITLYDAAFTDSSTIPSSDLIVAQFSFNPDSNYNIFRIDGDASGTYSESYSNSPSTTNIIASDAPNTQYISMIPYTINLAVTPTTNVAQESETTLTNNNLSDVSTLSGYNTYITIDLSNAHVSSDLVSVVVYAKNNGINMNYSTIQLLYDDTIVYQYNIFGADASDNYFRFDGPVIDASDIINEESIYYVVNIPGETMIVPWIDICANDVPIVSFNNYYRPLDSLIYEQDKFVAAGDNCIFHSNNGINWSGILFDSINGDYPIQKDQYFTSLSFGKDKYVAVANNVVDITCFTDPADPNTFSNVSIGNANVEGWNSVAYGNNRFIGVGNNQMFYYDDQVINTVDVSKNWTSVTFGEGVFVAVTPDGSNNHFISSVDGEVWNYINNVSAVDGSWNLVKYTQNIFMAFSDSQYMTSFDGIVWKTPIDISNNDYTDIVAGKDKVVLVTDSGIDTVFYSDLLITNNVNLGNDIDNGYKNSVAIGNGAIVGADNTIVLGNGTQNVGIGTSTPNSNLQVTGTEQVSSFTCGSTNHGGYKVMTNVQIGVTNTSLLPPSNISAETFLEKITTDTADISISQLADGNYNSMSLMTFSGGAYPNGVCGIQAYNTYTAQTGNLPLLINPAGGEVGIGTSTPDSNLHISSGLGANGDCILTLESDTDNSNDDANPLILFKQDEGKIETYMGYYYNSNSSSGGNSFKIQNTNNNNGKYSTIDFNQNQEIYFFVNQWSWTMSTSGVFWTPSLSYSSDRRLKSHIEDISSNFTLSDIDISGTDISGTVVSIMDSINALQPLSYIKYANYDLSGGYIPEFGFTVQDLIRIPLFRRLISLPDNFDINTLSDDISGNALQIGINYIGFIPILVKGIQIIKENIESLDTQISNLNPSDASYNAQIAALETQVNTQAQEIAALETQVNTQAQEIAALEAQDASYNVQIAALESQDASYNAQITALETQVNTQAQEITALEAQDASYNAQITALETQVNTQAQEIAALEAQDASYNAQITALETQVNTQAQEIAALEAQDASYNAQIAALEAQVNTQAQEIATRDASFTALQELVDRHERYLLILDYKYPDKV